MKNLLVFSFFPAFLPPKSGGEVRLFNFYFELSKFFNITLLSSGHLNSELETIWHTNNFVEKRVPKDSVFAEQWQRLTPHAGEGDLSGPTIAASGKFLTELHKAYLESYSGSDVIVHEFPFTLDYDLFIGLDDKPRVYNSHNCEYELYKKLHASSLSKKITELVRDVEVRLLKSVDLVTYCGADDLPSFEQMLPDGLPKTVFVPNGMTRITGFRSKLAVGIERVVFIGSGHLPNVEAAEFIVNILAPACPEITFDVIGNCLPLGNYPDNVSRHGMVDAKLKSELIVAADIAINPMLSGSGSSLKILDFVAHGVPVLSTPIGMRGFEFRNEIDCLLAEAENFPSLIKTYTKKPSLLAKMGVSAREFALENYTWSAIANKFRTHIEALLTDYEVGHHSKQYVLSLNDYDPFGSVGGGATRMQGLYAATSEWSHVVVMCFSKGSNIEVTDITEKIKCVRVPKTPEHIEEETFFNSRFHISTNDIVAFRQAGHNHILNEMYNVLSKHARIVVCEHPYMVSLPDRLGDRFVYSSQNFEYGLKKALLEWHPDKQMLLEEVLRAERLCVLSSALIVAVSNDDAESFTRGVNAAAPVIVVRNGAGTPAPTVFDEISYVKKNVKTSSVVFLGSAHMPNVDATQFIVESLAKNCPDIEFHLIGSVCQALPINIPSNVIAWGELNGSMKSAVLQQCKVAVNPMFSGSGSNVKLADFLANGLHVVSTSFGVRGYPDLVKPHVSIADEETFIKVIQNALDDPHVDCKTMRAERHAVFAEHLSMQVLATQFVDALKDLEKTKRRMLFVTYRYTSPLQGGAESMLAKLISGIGNSGEFTVDVISPEISSISENARFGSRYYFDSAACAPIVMNNVRFIRFPLAVENDQVIDEKLALAWRAQSEFEKQLYMSNKSGLIDSGLAWGWCYPEDGLNSKSRWALMECGLHLIELATVKIVGFIPQVAVVRVCDSVGAELLHREIESNFEMYFEADAGFVQFYVSMKTDNFISDPRPLGMYVNHIFLNGAELNLGAPVVMRPTSEDVLEFYLDMHDTACKSRGRQSVSLTDIRGPFSPELELFLEEFVKHYDIVVTHNSVFRPAIAAIAAAKAANVPSVLIPHAHLDDDFYHFPDVNQSALDADLVLAAPKEACRFYERIGAKRVGYLPAGIDVSETFSDDDERAFRAVHLKNTPFFLVLGRKAGAKGYEDVIREIEYLASKRSIHLVLIGPDDDGVVINSEHVTYLGLQSRNVVRGALKSCVGLVNMSSSESFGMVLLEAWLAGRPVIANIACSAFHDLAIHEENALLVSKNTLGAAMDRLAADKLLCDKLGAAGLTIVNQYSWDKVCEDFLSKCCMLVKPHDVKNA